MIFLKGIIKSKNRRRSNKTLGLLVAIMTSIAGASLTRCNTIIDTNEITVAAYYFPNYHTGDPRNEEQKGKG